MRFDFPTLERDLEATGVGLDAAALHGAVCGWLCAGRSDVAGLRHSMPASAEELERLPSDWLGRVLSIATQDLDDGELGFYPLIPSDARPLAERVRALASWCDAFLGAFGIAGGRAEDDGESPGILADLSAIARADDRDADPSAEESFVEILEYVRMAAIYLRMAALGRGQPR